MFSLCHALSSWAHPPNLATTLGLTSVLLHSPQIEVHLLHARISSCLTRLLVQPFVFATLRPQPVRYVLGLFFCLAQPSIQPSVFVAIRPKFVCYMLGLSLSDNLRCSHSFYTKHFLWPNTTLGIVIRLQSPQTEVHPLCARTLFGLA